MKRAALFLFLLTCTVQADAAFTYVGSFDVGDGPLWTEQPPVYSAREAAALIFGGNYWQYAISTNSNTTDAATINHLAFVDGYGLDNFLVSPTDEDFKLATNKAGTFSSFGSYSAYVHNMDFAPGPYVPGNVTGLYVNHVWYDPNAVEPVPEPSSFALLGFGLAGLAVRSRSKRV